MTTAPLDRAPLDPVTLEPTLRPLGRATMLPAAAYTSPAVLAWERRHLFAGSWTCLGRAADLTARQQALMVGDVPVLVTRAADGVLRALANTCRHRGHELLPEGVANDRGSLVCPYHAWSYALDGSLRQAPRFAAETVDADALHLVDLPLVEWHGWVLVNAAGTAVAFPEHAGALDGLVAPYAADRLVVGARHAYEVAANWKVVVENYHECYHCPLIHPELCRVSPPTSGRNYDLPGAWVGGSMELRDGMATMSLDGSAPGPFLDGVSRTAVEYLGLFPNLLLSLHPDYVMAHRLVPLEPARTWVECSWLVPPGASAAHAEAFWDLTNREDWAACESVQRGLASPHFVPGPFAPAEDAVHRWACLVARAYLGVAPHLPAP